MSNRPEIENAMENAMETTCSDCYSRFRITVDQLEKVNGLVRCGECDNVFNALDDLVTVDRQDPEQVLERELNQASLLIEQERRRKQVDKKSGAARSRDFRNLSLEEAMYGDVPRPMRSLLPAVWLLGIVLLSAIALTQIVYYQRYQLIENSDFRETVVTLCRFLPCSPSHMANTEQIQMLERNVFTHPVASDALMITGSFINQGDFAQKLPDLVITLFNLQGQLIASRLFTPEEYLLSQSSVRVLQTNNPVQFRLEVVDPGVDALTYEFEFV